MRQCNMKFRELPIWLSEVGFFDFLSFALLAWGDSVKKLRRHFGASLESLTGFFNVKGLSGNGVWTVMVEPASVKDPHRKCGARCRDGSFSTAFSVS